MPCKYKAGLPRLQILFFRFLEIHMLAKLFAVLLKLDFLGHEFLILACVIDLSRSGMLEYYELILRHSGGMIPN